MPRRTREEFRATIRPLRSSAWLLLLACSATGCALLDIDEYAGGDATAPSSTSGSGGTSDGGGGATSSSSVSTGGSGGNVDPCPGTAGPAGVRVGSFCIDETEVTQQQYYEFLTGGSTRELPGQAWCDWNTTVIPENWSDPPRAPLSPNNPVVDVDQCDAIAYCAWAGKRLCGHLQGGPISISERGPNPQLADARTDQWFYACSKGDDGMHAFAYANDYSPGTCNLAPGSLQPVKDFDACEGGFAGVHDLIGNVMEWEDSRDGPYATSNGTARGSSFDVMETPPEEAGCATTWTFARLIRRPDLGFRCCSGP